MLPRSSRLSREDFAALASDRTAKRGTSEHFSVVIKEGSDISGCGVVISKKIEKGSVQRHLLKRHIKSSIRTWCVPQRAIIVYARHGSSSLPFTALSTELEQLLTRLSQTHSS